MNPRALTLLLLFVVCFEHGAARTPNVKVKIKTYCRLSCKTDDGIFMNTVCKFRFQLDKSCKQFKTWSLKVEERQYVVDKHNEMRQKVASGNETRSGNNGASNMMVLNYDIGLEIPAIAWAMRCTFERDECRATPKFHMGAGQNLHQASSNKDVHPAKRDHFDAAVREWYDEIKEVESELIAKFDPVYKSNLGVFVRSYTQLVWAKTTHVGCVRVQFKREEKGVMFDVVHIVCNYGQEGNIKGQPVYLSGKPATKCPGKTKPNDKYKALCGAIEKISKKQLYPDDIGAAARITMSKYLIFLVPFVASLAKIFI